MKFQAKTNAKRQIDVRWDIVNTYLSRWKPGTYLTLEITRKQETKSDPMRKYYFSTVLKLFMDHLGYEPEEEELFHRQLKIVYFRIKPDKKGIYRNVPSVFSNESDLPISDKHEFVEWVIRKAAQEGVYIPTPGE
jgi:hypothetical protein